MADAQGDVNQIVREVFRRISSGGKESVSPCFTDEAIYELPYRPSYTIGGKNLGIVFSELVPRVFHDMKQWPIAIYSFADCETVIVEYASQATSAVDGSNYANRYVAVMKLRNGKIDFWREYCDLSWLNSPTGARFIELSAEVVPPEATRLYKDDPSNIDRWRSSGVLPEFDASLI